MKTIYLIFWILNAILLAVYSNTFYVIPVIHIWNCILSSALLAIRLILIHVSLDESKIPI